MKILAGKAAMREFPMICEDLISMLCKQAGERMVWSYPVTKWCHATLHSGWHEETAIIILPPLPHCRLPRRCLWPASRAAGGRDSRVEGGPFLSGSVRIPFVAGAHWVSVWTRSLRRRRRCRAADTIWSRRQKASPPIHRRSGHQPRTPLSTVPMVTAPPN